MSLLHDILYKVSIRALFGSTDIPVTDLQLDSRKVKPGSVFIAVKGLIADGHDYIETALQNGASAVICETMPQQLRDTVTYVQVENSGSAAGYMSHNFYGQPSEKLVLVGVTGTNGKTTIATLLFQLFTALRYKCGLISTVHNIIGARIVPATHTTPDAIHL
ncbi:MAG TPA: Mur ligase domain-containing protein, partial [Chitinophagaceae bacterium]|nr:Mur ligase domain-containing protein [Chitinophagaceae bacterium]